VIPEVARRLGEHVRGTRLTDATGKSSMTVQFVDGHFVDSYYPTIENTFSKMIRYKNQDFATEIIDTAGQVL
jgi:GTPase SAR1 family protein